MRKNEIDPRLHRWADMMVSHSLGTQFREREDSIEGKLVVVHGEAITQPLMLAFSYSLLNAGAHPYLDVHFATHPRGMSAGLPEMESGTEAQLTYVPRFMDTMFDEAGAHIYVLGTSHPFLTTDFQAQLPKIRGVNMKLLDRRLARPWSLTLYPTEPESIVEGFSTVDEYRDFIIGASIVDYAQMEKNQRVIKKLMEASSDVRLRTFDKRQGKLCDLEVEIGSNIVHSCNGDKNVPDGEIYTSPNTSRINGEVVLDVPVMFNGVEIAGVYLRIQNGKIVEYRADKGEPALRAIIETDEGSHMMGEMALGTNPHITRALKQPLFAEKIGGTCHMAIGRPYDDCYPELQGLEGQAMETAIEDLIAAGRYHRSAQHVDIPTDFRTPTEGQAVYIGSTQIIWDKDCWRPAGSS